MGLLNEFAAWYQRMGDTALAVGLVTTVAGTAVIVGVLSLVCILPNSRLVRGIRSDFRLKARDKNGTAIMPNSKLVLRIKNDLKLKAKAKNGTAILLTAEQFIVLSQADPEKYNPRIVKERFKLGKSKVILLSREMSKLDKYVMAKRTEQRLSELAKREAKERQATIQELQDIRDKLGKHIDHINKANEARAKVMVEQSHSLVSAVINGQSIRESGDTEPATQGIKEAELS